MIDANKETTEPRVTNGKGERFFCRNHDLVNCYEYLLQMTTGIFRFSYSFKT
jgi:hypothetical protein